MSGATLEPGRSAGERGRPELLETLGIVALFALAAAHGLARARFGFDLTDEGLYFSAPHRIALGDLPFRDETVNPHRSFDVLMAPLFRALPGLTVYAYRALGVALCTLSAFVLHRLLSRFTAPLLSAVACAATITIGPRIFAPGYHLLASCALVTSCSVWLMACLEERRGRRRVLAVVSGAVAFCGTLAYLPFLAVLVVPGVVLLRELGSGRRRSAVAGASAWMLCAFLLPASGAVAWVFQAGLAGDWANADRVLRGTGIYAMDGDEKLARHTDVLPFALAAVAGAMLVTWLCRRLAAGPAAGVAFGVLQGVLLFVLLDLAAQSPEALGSFGSGASTIRLAFSVLVWGVQLVALLAVLGARDLPPGYRLVHTGLLAPAAIFATTQVALSSHPHKLVWALPAVFATALVGLAVTGRARASGVPLLASFGLLAGLAFAVADRDFVYRNGPRSALTAAFSHPRLLGVRTQPKRVEHVEQVLDFLGQRVQRGERLLAYDQAPFLYFLTGTLPAVNTVWLSKRSPVAARVAAIEFMRARGREPRFCVRNLLSRRYSEDPARDPVHAFVLESYRLVLENPLLEVWERRSAR